MKKLLFVVVAGLLITSVNGETLNIAVASNFMAPMKIIAKRFEQASGAKLLISYAGSGTLANQIKNGAPYALFFSADVATVQTLVNSSLAVANSQFTYAIGHLALWSKNPQLIDSNGKILQNGTFTHLALANPQLVPYGAAAMQTLSKLNLTTKLAAKIVMADNISGTYQYVASGSAELGFVALSQIYYQGKISSGSAWIIPPTLSGGIKQDAVILKAGVTNPLASKFIAFIKSSDTQTLIHQFGYNQ